MFEPQMFEPIDQSHVEGSPELEIATDMARKAVIVAPALSCAYGLILVMLNFLVAAALLSWAAKVSPTMLMAATLGGFLVRMVLIVAAIVLVRHASWAVMAPMLGTILVTHIGLLMWETRYVSMSLAYPGLKPRKGA
jgi:hypothetical protein